MAVWRRLPSLRRGVLAVVMVVPSLAVPAVVLAAPPSAAVTGAIGAVSAATAAGAQWPSGQLGRSAAASATQTPAGVPFQVTYGGKSFAASLPPSSIATYTWTPGSNTVGVTETATSGGSLVKGVELAPQPSLSFGSTSGSLPAVTVNPSIAMQKIAGFGGAMTQSSASLINNSASEKRIMDALFGRAGAHFSIVRVPMGASDFVTGPIYQGGTSFSYDDNGGKPDPTLANFSVGTQSAQGAAAQACAAAPSPGEYGTGDYADTIPALLCAKAINPSLNLLAAPWSAPGWMKIDDSTVPGHCTGSDDFLQTADYPAYTSYFMKFLEAYGSAGLPVSEISMQNEPENCSTTYPTMEMKPSDQATFAKDLYSELRGGSLSAPPAIMAYDHNYLDNPNPPWNAPANQVTGYPEAVIKQSGGTSSPVGLVGFHHYNGTLAQEEQALDKEHHAYPNVPIWMTEATGTYGSTTAAQNLVWEGQHDLMEPLQNWASASLYLNLALNSHGGPHHGGCGYHGSDPCRGMVTLNAGGTYTLNEDYYDWAQFSKFIQPGATHICSDIVDLSASTVDACTSASSSWIPTSGDNLLDTVAFQNKNGSIVLVVLNTASSWGPPVVIDHAQDSGPLSCATVSFCVDVGESSGSATVFDGTNWADAGPVVNDGWLLGVSCPTTTFCVAVGLHPSPSDPSTPEGDVVYYNGTSWSKPVELAGTSGIVAVSCASVTWCMAAGGTTTGQPVAFTFNGKRWSDAAVPADYVQSLSCPSARFCAAAEENEDLQYFHGTTWSTPFAAAGSSADLLTVSCSSTTYCLAVAEWEQAAWVGNGSNWRTVSSTTAPESGFEDVSCAAGACDAAADVDGTPGVYAYEGSGNWSPVAAVSSDYGEWISCPAAGRCMVMGAVPSPATPYPLYGGAFTLGGQTWRSAAPDRGTVSALSCPSSQFCIAADDGYNYNSLHYGGPLGGNVMTYNGSAWSAPVFMDYDPTYPGYILPEGLTGLSCATSNFCAAVDQFGYAFTYNGSSWAYGDWLTQATNLPLTAVSCASSTLCAAVAEDGTAWVYNGSGWSPTSIDPYSEESGSPKSIPGDILDAVSCASPATCEALDSYGYTFSYSNGTWTAGTQLPGSGWAGISCGSATSCIAVGGGSYAVSTGKAWSAPKKIDSAAVNAVSCPSAAFCEAVDANGDALTYNGSAWTAPSPALPGIPLTTVSCAAPGTCMATGVDPATMESEAISGHPT